MTPSPDLLAVLREAREALSNVLDVMDMAMMLDTIPLDTSPDGPRGKALALLARIDSALRAHEAQGWRPITEANAQRALDAYTDAISSHPLATEEGTRDATRIRRIRLDAMIDALQTLAPPPETTT